MTEFSANERGILEELKGQTAARLQEASLELTGASMRLEELELLSRVMGLDNLTDDEQSELGKMRMLVVRLQREIAFGEERNRKLKAIISGEA